VILSQSFNIAVRIMRQIIRDRRTLVLIILVPVVVMTLIGLSFPEERVLDYIAPALLATLALFFSFLLTGISFLRERSQGTLERLMASPVSRMDIVVGYLFGFFSSYSCSPFTCWTFTTTGTCGRYSSFKLL
jgi:ABC-2 type transport system permease protein